jgi:hypothetical protein
MILHLLGVGKRREILFRARTTKRTARFFQTHGKQAIYRVFFFCDASYKKRTANIWAHGKEPVSLRGLKGSYRGYMCMALY